MKNIIEKINEGFYNNVGGDNIVKARTVIDKLNKMWEKHMGLFDKYDDAETGADDDDLPDDIIKSRKNIIKVLDQFPINMRFGFMYSDMGSKEEMIIEHSGKDKWIEKSYFIDDELSTKEIVVNCLECIDWYSDAKVM